MMKILNSNDYSLFQKINGIFSQDLQIYLSDFDFANAGHSSILNGLFEFSHYADTLDNTFVDIDDDFLYIYTDLKQKIKHFLHTFSINTTPTDNKMFEVASQKDWDFGDYDRYRKEANDINESARELFEAMKIFVINGKKRISMQEPKNTEEFTTRSFNEMFNKVNIEGTSSYLTGPQFFKIINKVDPSHPDYTQYIDDCRRMGVSTSRKHFFKDVLDRLETEIRDLAISEIHQHANAIDTNSEFNKKSGDATRISTENKKIVKQDFTHVESPQLMMTSSTEAPKVFISYSWDNEIHKDWILKLSKDLRSKGIETILDRYNLSPGANASHFMENAIESADKVLIIFTENYNKKASGRQGGVGVEYSIVNSEISSNITDNKKYVPILRQGTMETAIPSFMKQYILLDMINDGRYDTQLKELVHSIFEKPMVEIPEIGSVPDYI